MNLIPSRLAARLSLFVCLFALVPVVRAQHWIAPTQEELKMTSQAEVPGAPAVYLYREEITNDEMHSWSKYVRLKVLTEAGKDYANVKLTQYQTEDDEGFTVSDIQGRTIQPDGTIIPFTGKPYTKLIEKSQGLKVQAKVFTLPDVKVGSILEYRYVLRYDDNVVFAPSWFIQSELYTRKAHYVWKPTTRQLVSQGEHGEQMTSTIAWAPILPKGVEVKQTRIPTNNDILTNAGTTFELDISNVPPTPDETHMPPLKSFSYRVLFYYSPYHSLNDFWKSEGKDWSKSADKFISPGQKVQDAVATLTASTDTPEQKLRKYYAAVMQLDNSVFNRTRSAAEQKAEGLNPPKNTDDIWERKRGTDDQITELFVAMARAAGMKAYVMDVTDRDRSIFFPSYLNFSQLDDLVAIVVVDGKEQYFDPGQRYCPFGHLAWKHTMARGIRQNDNGTAIAETPPEPYTASRTQRIADLVMDTHGQASGIVRMTWTGAPALAWRQSYLRGDATSLNHDLRTSMEHLLPNGMDVQVGSIMNLDDYEKPFTVIYQVKGQLASSAGKLILVPGDLFVSGESAAFPRRNRQSVIYFDYPYVLQDAVRVRFPSTYTVESAPATEKLPLDQDAFYALSSKTTPDSILVQRNFELGSVVFPVSDYSNLRTFFNKFETKDQEPSVLKLATSAPVGD